MDTAARAPHTHTCPGCGRVLANALLACLRCTAALPTALRHDISRTWLAQDWPAHSRALADGLHFFAALHDNRTTRDTMTTPDTHEYDTREGTTWRTRHGYWALVNGEYRCPAPWERAALTGTTIMPLIHNRPLLELLDDSVIAAARRDYWDMYSDHTCSWCLRFRHPCTCDEFPLCDAMCWRPGDPVVGDAPSTRDDAFGPVSHPNWERVYAHLEED